MERDTTGEKEGENNKIVQKKTKNENEESNLKATGKNKDNEHALKKAAEEEHVA